MTLNRWIKLAIISISVVALTSCSSMRKHNNDQAAVNDANAAYNGAQTAGLGNEDGFREGNGSGGSHGRDQLLAKRVYYFDFDQSNIHPDDGPALAANADYLIGNTNKKILLEGHTDPRGSREYNIGLGERRAQAIAAALRAKGVNPDQVRVISYGAEKLGAPGHTEEDYQMDRRVVIVTLQR